MKDNPVAKNAHKFNKRAAGPHKDKKKAMKKGDRKHKGSYESVDEVLKVSDGASAWIKDFQASDAPQFKGKSMDKRKEMALAAYLDAKNGTKNEFFGRLALAAVGAFAQAKRNQKVDHPKAKSNLGLWDHKEKTMDDNIDEWSCNTTEKTRRVKGGDKRKKYMKEKQIEEGEKKGLWDRIHAKRKRGEKPAKPGDEDYPKTLDVGEETVQEISSKLKDRYRTKARADVDKQYKKGDMAAMKGDSKGVKQADRRVMTRRTGVQRSLPKDSPAKKGQMVPTRNEGLKQARKNVGSDSCWDGYKATGTKMKGGKEVPDCKKEDAKQVDEVITKTVKKVGSAVATAAKTAAIDPKAHAAINTAKGMAKDTASDIKKGAKKVSGAAKKVGSAVKKVTTRKPVTNKESMDPRDFTDKAGYIVTITRKGGKEEIKNFFNTKPAAQKYADRVKNTNKVGHVATIYKTDGRKLMKESSAGVEMQSVSGMLDELTKRDQERLAKRKQTNLVKRGKAKPEPKPKKAKEDPKDRTYVSNRKGDDDHIVMQLRKAQDVKGNMDIKVSPTGKSVKLPIKMIDKLLATHDKLQKPDEKRKFRIMVTKELRKRAK